MIEPTMRVDARRSVPRRWRRWAGSLVLAAGLAASPGGLAGQERPVRLAERPTGAGQERLATLLERGGYDVWSRDTVLARADTVRGTILLLDATARIAGTVIGDLFVVAGDLFLRTGGRVTGNILVLGGGFYGSDLARVEGEVRYRPGERLRVVPEAGGFVIFPVEEELASWDLDGTYGFHAPSYQRVDAVRFEWGGAARAPHVPGRPDVEASVRYKTGPGSLEGSIRPGWHLSDRIRVGLTASRATRSNETWIRRGWVNSLFTVVAGDDVRDYYRSDRIGVEAEWTSARVPSWSEEPRWSVGLRAGWEEARSLDARDVTVLLGDDDARLNPAVDPGDLYSLGLGVQRSHVTPEGSLRFGLGVEAATDGIGDFDFILAEARLAFERALPVGSLEAFGIARGHLAGTLPGQRRSGIGGNGTLPTVSTLGLRGERLVFADLTYAYPLFTAGRLGGFDVFGRLAGGAAWSEGRPFRLEENGALGVRARVLGLALEWGLAAGGTPGRSGLDFEVFFDARLSRAHRPTTMPRAGRSF